MIAEKSRYYTNSKSAQHDGLGTCSDYVILIVFQIWDIRQQKCIYTIPAHNNIVTSLRYQRGMGDFLVSCSYDTNASIWACPGFLPIKTLPHQGKLMSLDVSAKGTDFNFQAYSTIYAIFKLDII